MKKNVIILISCVVLLLAVGGVYAALMMTGDKDTASSSGAESEEEIYVPVSILKFESTDIKSINVKNSVDEFVGVPDGQLDDNGNALFTIQGMEELELNNNTNTLVNSASTLNSEATAEEEASDLDKYGLKSPAAEVTVKSASEEKTLLIGNEAPVKGQTYCMEKGGKAVYLVSTSSVSVFLNNKESFVSTSVLEDPDGENEELTLKVASVKVERTDIDYDILIKYDDLSEESGSNSGSLATHYMAEPSFAYLNPEKLTPIVKELYGMSASSVLKKYPSDKDLAEFGLDKPFCTVTMKIDKVKEDGKTIDHSRTEVLKIGKKTDTDGNSYPVMVNDKKVIYSVSSDDLCWAELNPADIISRLVFGINVWDIGTLEVGAKGAEKAVFNGSGTSADDYVVTKNGKSCDTERFRSFYKFLLQTSAEDLLINGQKPDEEPIAYVNVKTQNGKTSQNVEFYKADGKMAMIVVNDESFFKCRMAFVDLLIDNLKKFDSSEDFVMNW